MNLETKFAALPEFSRQRLAPINNLFAVLSNEKEQEKVFSWAMIKTCAELQITLPEFYTLLDNNLGLETVVQRLEDHSIVCVQSRLQAHADWQKTDRRISLYLESIAADTPPENLPSRVAVRDAIYRAEEFFNSRDITDDQRDEPVGRVFFHEEITRSLAKAQSDPLSELSYKYTAEIDGLRGDLSKEEWGKIVQEAVGFTCKALRINKEQFFSSLNNPVRTADIAQSFIIQVKLGLQEHSYTSQKRQSDEASFEQDSAATPKKLTQVLGAIQAKQSSNPQKARLQL